MKPSKRPVSHMFGAIPWCSWGSYLSWNNLSGWSNRINLSFVGNGLPQHHHEYYHACQRIYVQQYVQHSQSNIDIDRCCNSQHCQWRSNPYLKCDRKSRSSFYYFVDAEACYRYCCLYHRNFWGSIQRTALCVCFSLVACFGCSIPWTVVL